MKYFLLICSIITSQHVCAQAVDSIYFHLYTDSLKKGPYNYINVDAKMNNGRYLPLTAKEIIFESSAGEWKGNSLIIDTTYKRDSVVIKATLKENPLLTKTITIYVKKSTYEGKVMTEDELQNSLKRKKRKDATPNQYL